MATLEIRPVQPEDAAAVNRSFNEVFSAAGLDRPARTLPGWRWAYERNPAGRRAFVALDGDRVVAQFAALPVRTLLDGGEVVFSQGVDSFALPSHRGGAGASAFVRTARAFFDAYGGSPDTLLYGWPSERAWRLGKQVLGYEAVRTQPALVQPLDTTTRGDPPQVEQLTTLDHQARWLFERCAGDFAAAALRDDAFLTWRFLEHPEVRYELLGVRDLEGILRGLAVYRLGAASFDGLGLVVDWLVPPGESEVGALLLEALLARSRRDGARALAAWLPEWSPWFGGFQEKGFRVHPTPWRLALKTFTRRIDAAWLREGWWFTLADSDLV